MLPKKYNIEKVLYFASRTHGLNVSKDEPNHTDLSKMVKQYVSLKLITQIGKDDFGRYYGITDQGRITLLNLQINYRKSNNMDYKSKEIELAKLEQEMTK